MINWKALAVSIAVSASLTAALASGQVPGIGSGPPATGDTFGNALGALRLKGISINNKNFWVLYNNTGNVTFPSDVPFGSSDVAAQVKNGVLFLRYGSGETTPGLPALRNACTTGKNAAEMAGTCLFVSGDLQSIDDAGTPIVITANTAALGDVLGKLPAGGNPDVGYFAPNTNEVKRATSDTTWTNSSTFTDITGLTGFTIKAGKLYALTARLTVTVTATTAADFKFQSVFTGVGSGAAVDYTVFMYNAGTQVLSESIEIQADSTSTGVLSMTSGGTGFVHVQGYVLGGSTDGTIKFQGAQNTATSSHTTTVKTGSMAMLSKGS